MTNWTLVAAGLDTGLSAAEIEKIAPVLDALEGAFHPLTDALRYEAEPAVTFDALPEERP